METEQKTTLHDPLRLRAPVTFLQLSHQACDFIFIMSLSIREANLRKRQQNLPKRQGGALRQACSGEKPFSHPPSLGPCLGLWVYFSTSPWAIHDQACCWQSLSSYLQPGLGAPRHTLGLEANQPLKVQKSEL